MLIENDVTFFDSHYAATALRDRVIISMVNAYDSIPNLTRCDPDEIS